MTATYDTTLATDTDKVRLLTGDTAIASARFSDEEIGAALTATGGVYAACAMLFDGLAAKYAVSVNISVDGYSRGSGKIADNFMKMANRFRAMAAMKDAGGLGAPFVGGISEDEIQAQREDVDRVPNYFEHDMMQNPSANSDYEPQ